MSQLGDQYATFLSSSLDFLALDFTVWLSATDLGQSSKQSWPTEMGQLLGFFRGLDLADTGSLQVNLGTCCLLRPRLGLVKGFRADWGWGIEHCTVDHCGSTRDCTNSCTCAFGARRNLLMKWSWTVLLADTCCETLRKKAEFGRHM